MKQIYRLILLLSVSIGPLIANIQGGPWFDVANIDRIFFHPIYIDKGAVNEGLFCTK